MKHRSRIVSIVTHHCPRCREGRLFETRITSMQKLFHMQSQCPVCGLGYYPEPGFYYGAMFISYIITAFYSLGFIGIALFVFDLSVNAAFVWLFFSMMIFYAWFYRTARSVWIHVNVKYDPEAIQKAKANGISAAAPGYVNRNF